MIDLREAACLQHEGIAQRLQPTGLEACRLQHAPIDDTRCWRHGREDEALANHGIDGGVQEVQVGLAALRECQCGVVAVLVADCGHVRRKRHVD